MRLIELEANEASDIRLDSFLGDSIEELSRSYVQKLIKDGLVKVDGVIRKSNYKLKGDESIRIELPEIIIPDILPEDIPLDIVYEDDDIILVNKPKGMVVHPAAGHYSGTLV